MGGVNGSNSRWMEEMENGVFILWKDPSFVGGGGKEPLKERADKLDEREEKQCNKQVSGKLKEEIDCSQGIRGGQQREDRTSLAVQWFLCASTAAGAGWISGQGGAHTWQSVAGDRKRRGQCRPPDICGVHSHSPYLPVSGGLMRRSWGLRRKTVALWSKDYRSYTCVFIHK